MYTKRKAYLNVNSYLFALIQRDSTSATSPEHTVLIRSLTIEDFPLPFSPINITGLP